MTTSVEISFDLNKAAVLSRNLASASYVDSHTIANLTTNAAQFEPGEFSNGIVTFDSNTNVFIIHNSGSDKGANQRYAYIGLATQIPLTLTEFNISVQTNAQVSHSTEYVLEASPRDDFSGPIDVWGEFAAPSGGWTGFTLGIKPFEVPIGGVTYIRIRVNSPIPDGTNYVAYKDMRLAGSVKASTLTPGPRLDPKPGQEQGTSNPVELLYDFNTANQSALNVASSQKVPNVCSVVTTYSSLFEPGEFPNGVSPFGPDNNVFQLHNVGGANQRYAFVALATQQPMVLTALQVNVGSNARGNSPTNPVIIAVEASSTDDFALFTPLGTVSTVTKTLDLNMPIPRGITYLRLRSTFFIPDGSNYIAYDHLKLTGSIATS